MLPPNKSFQLLHRRKESGNSSRESSYYQLKKTLKICKDLKEDPTCSLSLTIEQRKMSMTIYKFFEILHTLFNKNKEQAFFKIIQKEMSDSKSSRSRNRLEDILFQVYNSSSPQKAQPFMRAISNRKNYYSVTRRHQQVVTDISMDRSDNHFDLKSCSRTDLSGSLNETVQHMPLFCNLLNGVLKSIQLKQKLQAFQSVKRVGESRVSDFSQFLQKLNLLQAKATIFNDQLLSLQTKCTRQAYKQIYDFAEQKKILEQRKIEMAEKLIFKLDDLFRLQTLSKPKIKPIKPGAEKIFEKIMHMQKKTLRQAMSIIALLKLKKKKVVSLVLPPQQNSLLLPKPPQNIQVLQPVIVAPEPKNPIVFIKVNDLYLRSMKNTFQTLKQINQQQYVVTLQVPALKNLRNYHLMEQNIEILVQTLVSFEKKIIQSYCYDLISSIKKTLFRKSYTNIPSRGSFRKSLQNESSDQIKFPKIDQSIVLEDHKSVTPQVELKNGQEVIFTKTFEIKFEVKLVLRRSTKTEGNIRGHRRTRSICKPQEPQPESPRQTAPVLEVPEQRKLSKMGRAATMKQITQKKDITSRKLRVPTEPQKIIYVVEDNLKKGYLLKAVEKSQDIPIPNDSTLLLNLRMSQTSQTDFKHASKQYAFEMTPIQKIDRKRLSTNGTLLISQFSSFSSETSIVVPTIQQKYSHYSRIFMIFFMNLLLSILFLIQLISGKRIIGSAFIIPLSHLSPIQIQYVDEFYKSSKVKLQVFITFIMTIIINIVQQIEWKVNKNCLIFEFQAEFYVYLLDLIGLFYIGFEIFKKIRRNY